MGFTSGAQQATTQTNVADAPGDLNSRDLPAILSSCIASIGTLGEGYGVIAGRLAELQRRLAEGRFHLAVLGQFKRGKSTLLNALLGEEVLPTAVVPLTAIPTFIHSGEERLARVYFQERDNPQQVEAEGPERLRDFLTDYVTETGNPNNKLGVSHVEVFHPASLLKKGVVLIDTPGIGSTFRHNTEATLNFLPQCDAALFLVSADPPITEVEVQFLRQVRSKVPRLFFILNKVDYLGDEDRHAALAFLEKVLREEVDVPRGTEIFPVSARQGLAGRIDGDDELWRVSGIPEVEHHLLDFLENEKGSALREAVSCKAADALDETLLRLRLAMRSLQMPLENLAQRMTILEAKIDEARREREQVSDLLSGDRRRMHQFLEEHTGQLRGEANEYLRGIVREALVRDGQASEERVLVALGEAIPGYFEHQVGQTAELFREQVAQILEPHQERADALIEGVRKTAAELFDVPYHAPESSDAFEMAHRPYWVKHKWTSSLIPIPTGLLDRSLPASARLKRTYKRLFGQVEELVVSNVENLRWATFQSIDQTFSQFGSALDERLAETIEATHGAIHAAMERRRSHSKEIADEEDKIQTATKDLEQLREELESLASGARVGDESG